MKQSFPMLIIPVGLYNVLALVTWIAPGVFGSAVDATNRTLFTIPMLSHGALALTFGDIILIVGLVALFAELVSSTSSSNQALIGDALTLLVVCLVEFLLLAPFATATFLLLLVMVMMDSLAGFIVSTVSARKDIALGQ
jgi:hypothetical protein